MNTGDIIKARRLELGLTLEDLAEALEVNKTTVMRYESNQVRKMPIDIIPPLSRALRCSKEYLMGWTDNPSYVPEDIKTLWDDISEGVNFSEEEIRQIVLFAKFIISQRKENNE